MDRFGDIWIRHWEKIEQNWKASVTDDDLVLVAGDHSWGLKLDDALPDLQFVAALPGTKIMSKGNHDLWWALGKLQKLNLPRTLWVQGNAVQVGDVCVAGTRGWALPGTEFCNTEADQAIYRREVGRLRQALANLPGQGRRLAMMHYPPLLTDLMDTEFTRLFEEFQISQVVYGHLHIGHLARAFEGTHRGVEYRLVSCDVVGFKPVKVVEV